MLSPLDIFQLHQNMRMSPIPSRSGMSSMPSQLPDLSYDSQNEPSAIMRMASPKPSFEPTSGSKMEAESKNSIDNIMQTLLADRVKDKQNDRNMQWMSFFSKLASSTNPSALGALGEGASSLTETMGKQAPLSRAADRDIAVAQIAQERWNKEQEMKQAENMSEAALRRAQANYYGSAAKLGGIAPSDVREWEYFSKLKTPEEKEAYMELKRRGAKEAGDIKLSEKTNEGIAENFTLKRKAAEDANLSLRNNEEAKKLLDSGIITGTGADYIKGIGKALNQVGMSYAEDEIANTEAFVSARGAEVGRLIKQFGAGTGLSDADRDFAERMAAGKIDLNEKSIRKIIELNDKAARNTISIYNDELKKMPSAIVPYDISVKDPTVATGKVRKWNPTTGKIE